MVALVLPCACHSEAFSKCAANNCKSSEGAAEREVADFRVPRDDLEVVSLALRRDDLF